jgi:hypothetical protein
MSPSELNAVARPVLIAEQCGAEYLDSYCAYYSSNVREFARRIVKSKPEMT